jgi:dUTP pyrophosphatase
MRGSEKAARFYLQSPNDVMILAKSKEVIKTALQLKLPAGCYGRVAPHSGLALQHHIDIGGGIIDEDYQANLGVIIFIHSEKPFNVFRGDYIAQLICEKIYYPEIKVVKELDDTKCGDKGFGSTGCN